MKFNSRISSKSLIYIAIPTVAAPQLGTVFYDINEAPPPRGIFIVGVCANLTLRRAQIAEGI